MLMLPVAAVCKAPTGATVLYILGTGVVYWKESGNTIRIMVQGLQFNIL